jgi:predicted small lipoprotein YifL
MMKNRFKTFALAAALALTLASCGNTAGKNTADTRQEENRAKLSIEDGIYHVDFDTDSRMFHVNEACNGKATLTVKDKEGTVHLIMPSKNIVALFPGKADDAKKKDADKIKPTEEEVTYSDGLTEKVFAFDVPVPVLEKEFDLALIGTKGVWYDHKVSVSHPTMDGAYRADLTLEGGSGRASITSPADIVAKDKAYLVQIEWSSPFYDYMIVDQKKYKPVNKDGNSIFKIPVKDLHKPVKVIADTVAMSKPHEIEYTISFDHIVAK